MMNWTRKPRNLDKKMTEGRNSKDFPFEHRCRLRRQWNAAGTAPLENEMIKHGQSYLELQKLFIFFSHWHFASCFYKKQVMSSAVLSDPAHSNINWNWQTCTTEKLRLASSDEKVSFNSPCNHRPMQEPVTIRPCSSPLSRKPTLSAWQTIAISVIYCCVTNYLST